MCGERSRQESYFTRDDITRGRLQSATMRRMVSSTTNHHRRRHNVGSTPTRRYAKNGCCFCGIPPTTQRESYTHPPICEEWARAFPIAAQPPWSCNAQYLRNILPISTPCAPCACRASEPLLSYRVTLHAVGPAARICPICILCKDSSSTGITEAFYHTNIHKPILYRRRHNTRGTAAQQCAKSA